jgi:hypothetical protein
MILLRLAGWVAVATMAAGALGCTSAPQCGSTPCPSGPILFSPCGFKSISSTCSGFTDAGVVRGAANETCSLTVTYGNGTTVTSTLTFRDGDDCCPGVRLVAMTPGLAPPLGCVADAGADASATDAGGDGPAE